MVESGPGVAADGESRGSIGGGKQDGADAQSWSTGSGVTAGSSREGPELVPSVASSVGKPSGAAWMREEAVSSLIAEGKQLLRGLSTEVAADVLCALAEPSSVVAEAMLLRLRGELEGSGAGVWEGVRALVGEGRELLLRLPAGSGEGLLRALEGRESVVAEGIARGLSGMRVVWSEARRDDSEALKGVGGDAVSDSVGGRGVSDGVAVSGRAEEAVSGLAGRESEQRAGTYEAGESMGGVESGAGGRAAAEDGDESGGARASGAGADSYERPAIGQDAVSGGDDAAGAEEGRGRAEDAGARTDGVSLYGDGSDSATAGAARGSEYILNDCNILAAGFFFIFF